MMTFTRNPIERLVSRTDPQADFVGLLADDVGEVVAAALDQHTPELPDWRAVREELERALPSDLATEGLSPSGLIELAISEAPAALLNLSRNALRTIQVARLAAVLGEATRRDRTGRAIDGDRLAALWETERGRKLWATEAMDRAVRGLAANADRVTFPTRPSPGELAGLIIDNEPFAEMLASNEVCND